MTRRYLVSGTVQGVGYRWFVQREAARLGLGGTVRNLRDGRVEVTARGPWQVLTELEARLRDGPSRANVTNVESTEISDEIPLPIAFSVKR